MITYYGYDEKNKVIEKIDDYRPGVWIHVEAPTIEEKQYLVDKHKLVNGHIDDVLDENEVPRFEIEEDVLYLFLRFPHIEDVTTVTLPFLVVILSDCIITFSLYSPLFIRQVIEKKINFRTNYKEKVLVLVLSEITNLYYQYLNRINKEIRQIRRTIEKIKNKNIVQFVAFEEILNDFRPSLLGTDNVLKTIISSKTLTFDKYDTDKLEDIHLSNKQIIESCEDTLASIRNIREAYTTILTNNLNRVIKLFTSMTVILTIPTMIASLYGMNVTLPYAEYPYASMGILVFIVLIIVGLLLIFQKKDWL